MRINIIGGGLAGCSLAYVLKNAGAEPVIYEASESVGSGASGNDIGLYNPRFTAEFDEMGQFYSVAFFEALEVFERFGDAIDWSPCGAVHLINNDQKERRFGKMVRSWGWAQEDMRLVRADEASSISGVSLDYDALYLPRSGTVSPRKLCGEYVRGVEVRLNQRLEDFPDGPVVLACGMACLNFDVAAHLPLKPVRGQITYVRENALSKALKTTIGYGGYISPALGGVHCLGATFERGQSHESIDSGDDVANLDKLFQNVKSMVGDYEIISARASVRTTTPDHCPIIGQLGEKVYITTAHGSHGILSSLRGAYILRDLMIGNV